MTRCFIPQRPNGTGDRLTDLPALTITGLTLDPSLGALDT